jgi:hypothetical protein
MYYDDRFDPTLENDYDANRQDSYSSELIPMDLMEEEFESGGAECDSSEFSQVQPVLKKNTGRKRSYPKHMTTLSIPTNTDKQLVKTSRMVNRKKVDIQYYRSSFQSGSSIRHAIDGTFSNIRVGSKDNVMLFKVVLTSNTGDKEPHHLYFDNPEQYERHFFTKLDEEYKKKWNENKIRYML